MNVSERAYRLSCLLAAVDTFQVICFSRHVTCDSPGVCFSEPENSVDLSGIGSLEATRISVDVKKFDRRGFGALMENVFISPGVNRSVFFIYGLSCGLNFINATNILIMYFLISVFVGK